MSTQNRQTFSPEFKREAVRLLEQGDKEAAQLAREVGIKCNQLYKWKEEIDTYGEEAFPGHGNRPPKSKKDDSAALRAENKRLKEEIEISKKAAIYFARESG
jgi:transposase